VTGEQRDEGRGASPQRTIAGLLGFGAALATTLALAWVVVGHLDAPFGGGGAPAFDLSAIARVRATIDALDASTAKGRRPRVVLLGDSTAISYGDHPGVGVELKRALVRAGIRNVAVINGAYPMMTPIDYFCASRELAAAGPDAVVLTLNPLVLGERVPRTDMAGLIPPAALPWALGYPLHRFGLTLDRLLMSTVIVQSGAIPLWEPIVKRQTQLGDWRGLSIRRDLDRGLLGELRVYAGHLMEVDGRIRGDRTATEMRFGEALAGIGPDHPVARLVGGAVEALRERDIVVAVYVNPVNLDWLREVGFEDHEGLRRSIAVVRALVEGHGGVLVDLHDLLPDAGFWDMAHMIPGPPYRAAQRIGRRVADTLAPLLVDAR
jgi:hypothetical protein